MSAWASRYVGLPFVDGGRDGDGADCWGLARLVYAQELAIELEDRRGDYRAADGATVEAVIQAGIGPQGWIRVDRPNPFDMILMRQGRHASHVGVAIDQRMMLHAAHDGAIIEPYTGAIWSRRILAFYRHSNRI